MGPSRLLLVDDDRLSLAMLGDWLRGFGHRVDLAMSAEEALVALALARAEAAPVELVITDLVLPGRDGLALLAEARRLDPDVDVAVITALEQVAPAVRALKAGAVDYLLKPISKDSLELSVSRCLATRRLARENQALREQVALFERGRRISGTLDPAELWPLSLSTLAEAVGASAGALATLDPQGAPTLVAEVSLPTGRARELLDRLGPQLRSLLTTPGLRWLDAATVAGLGQPSVLVPCPHEGEVRCAGILLPPRLPQGTVREVASSRAAYLGRHVGLAQANASRFEDVERLAFTDDLTGLRNDRALRAELDRQLGGQPGQPLALLFLDLDHFKLINDAHGHPIGSRVLTEVGRVLRGCVRDIDLAARYGGDEFAVVLPGSDSGEALKVAERLRRSLAEHTFAEGIRLTVTIGVACHPENSSDRDLLLTLADAAMYRGKRANRNVVYLAER